MSTPMNNNIPLQNVNTPSNSTEFVNSRQGPSSSGSAIRSQRTQQEQANNPHRNRSSRTNRGRGRQNANPLRFGNRTSDRDTNDVESSENHVESSLGVQAPDTVASVVDNSGGRTRGRGRGGNGKYRQRQQTNQLLDGMTPLSDMDIDLAESIVPTSSSGRENDTGKGRHATNSRKMNLTHLLNCKFERRQRGNRYQASTNSNDSHVTSHQRNVGTHYRDPGTIHKFSKQQFLQANCQFVMLDGYEYTIHKVDPDWPVDWNRIEEVRFKQSASTETTCPICLEPPVAAKITRCGHIYCWTCMLHYLSLSDENCRQCPICFEPVYRGDLRSVISHFFTNYSIEEEIVMRLMIRKKGCVEVEPFGAGLSSSPDLTTEQPKTANVDQYWSKANLVIVDSQTVIENIVQRERSELSAKLKLDKDEPEVCFIEQAIGYLDKRVERLQNKLPVEPKSMIQYGSEQFTPQNSSEIASKSYLFYQCTDGQHIYLNPFSTKVLCHEYQSLESCPLEIKAKILQMDWISMSETWRKRFRYLEHLPLTCEFRLIEIDFEKSGMVSQETYELFKDQIKKREQERERRRREERKREKIIQVEQNRRIYGIQPSLKINLDNTDQFPSVSDERYLGLSRIRNRTTTDENSSSGGEEHDISNESRGMLEPTESEPEPTPTVDVADDDSSMNAVSGLALSFRDIQLQEAAKVAQQSGKDSKRSTSAWAAKNQGPSGPQSSFAQLLVNAKTSKKEWTRHVSSKPGQQNASTANNAGSRSNQALDSDDGGEELRAAPCEFTISDFIDMNIVTSAGKKKRGKSKRG